MGTIQVLRLLYYRNIFENKNKKRSIVTKLFAVVNLLFGISHRMTSEGVRRDCLLLCACLHSLGNTLLSYFASSSSSISVGKILFQEESRIIKSIFCTDKRGHQRLFCICYWIQESAGIIHSFLVYFLFNICFKSDWKSAALVGCNLNLSTSTFKTFGVTKAGK